MVLKEFKIINENHKLVILGAMAIGVLYPFFTDFSIFGLDNPKFISIGLLLAGMLLFWEIYGNKQYKDQTEYKQRSAQYPSQQYSPHHNQPTHQGPHPSSYDDQLFNEANIPVNPEAQRPTNPVYHHPKYPPRREVYYTAPTEEQQEETEDYYEEPDLPRVSDVVKRKVRLPDRVPPPKDIPLVKSKEYSKTNKSSFKKFGL